jgi:hypothetical protein
MQNVSIDVTESPFLFVLQEATQEDTIKNEYRRGGHS